MMLHPHISKFLMGRFQHGRNKAVKEREKGRRKIKRSSSPYDFVELKRTNTVATKVIKAAKTRSWRSFCSKFSYSTKLSSLLKLVKRINNTNKNDNIPALKNGDLFTTSTAEKANVLGAHFAKISGTGNYSESCQRHKEEFEKGK